jgi:glycosyltransferase involved in cell wall biosynthesis
MDVGKSPSDPAEVVSEGPERREIVFTFVGTLDYRGRLQKEIGSLRKAGLECRLILGNIGEREVVRERYGFPIEEIKVPCFKGKVRFFLSQLRFAWLAGRSIARSPAETVVCVALDSVLAGVVAKWLRPSLRLIFDSNELHLESFNSRLKKLVWRPLQALAIRASDAIIHAEPNRLEYFRRVYGGHGKRQEVIENFPHYHTGKLRRVVAGEPVRVIYLGALGDDRYTHELIAAGRAMGGRIELDLVGFATPQVMAELERRYGSQPALNIRLLPPVPYEGIPALLEAYQIGIALYKNTNLNNYYCAPNKVYDYLMSGMAVIANDYPGLRKVLEVERLGACVSEVTPASMAEAVERIVSEQRWNQITDEVRQRYSWEAQEGKLLAAVAGRE